MKSFQICFLIFLVIIILPETFSGPAERNLRSHKAPIVDKLSTERVPAKELGEFLMNKSDFFQMIFRR